MSNEKDLFSPKFLDEFVGKPEKVKILKKSISFAQQQGAPLGHTLITGPSGVGKSILFELIAKEAQIDPSNIRRIIGSDIKNAQNLVTLLQSLEDFGMIFIDEIHGLKREYSEPIYSALTDGVIYLDEKGASRKIQLPKFTLIGASSEWGEIPTPLERRFESQIPIDFYKDEEMLWVLELLIRKTKLTLSEEEKHWLISNARGTPGELTKFVKKLYKHKKMGNNITIQDILAESDIEYGHGLTSADWRYLEFLDDQQSSEEGNDSIGINIIVSAIGLTGLSIKRKVEPYLIFKKLIKVNKSGRSITERGIKLLEGYKDWKNEGVVEKGEMEGMEGKMGITEMSPQKKGEEI